MPRKLKQEEIEGVCRRVLGEEGLDPRAHDHMVARFAQTWDQGDSRRRVAEVFRAKVRGYGR